MMTAAARFGHGNLHDRSPCPRFHGIESNKDVR
jgi:hypothetical protein